MVTVNSKFLKDHHPEAKLKDLVKLALAAKEIDEVALPALPQLIRLDLAGNKLSRLEGLAACTSLKWLNLAANQISSIGPLATLGNLQVLNLGSNQLKGTIGVASLTSLGALILPDNQLTGITGLAKLPQLNTLVLKGNALQSLGRSLEACTGLKKLSLGHNALTSLGPALQSCHELHELRLSHNQLTSLPAKLAACSRLRILDAGHNPIVATSAVAVLGKLTGLRNLCLAGCPLATASNYQASLLSLSSSITILDGKHLEGRSKPRRPKLLTSPEPAAAAQATAAVKPASGHAAASDRSHANHGASSDQQSRQQLLSQDRAERPNGLDAVRQNSAGRHPANDSKSSKLLRHGGGDDNGMPVKDSRQNASKRQRAHLEEAAPAFVNDSTTKKPRKAKHGSSGEALQQEQADKAASALPNDCHPKQSSGKHVSSRQQRPLPADSPASEGVSQQQQQQQALLPGAAGPAVGSKDNKKRRLDVQSHAEIKGSSRIMQPVEEHHQPAAERSVAASESHTKPDAASAAPGGRQHDRKAQHMGAGKHKGPKNPPEAAEDEDRVVELQPMAVPKQREQAQSGVLGVFEARGRQAKASVQRVAGQPKKGRSEASKTRSSLSQHTKSITGAAAAHLLMQQAQPASADIDDLPGW